MTGKKIYRYTNVELLDVIKNGQNKTLLEGAKSELEKRNLSEQELRDAEEEYIKFSEYKEKRKDEPLTREEWMTLFFMPLVPKPRWRKDHFSESEYQRFDKYGFDKKAKQASEAQMLGYLFWFVVILFVAIAVRYFDI